MKRNLLGALAIATVVVFSAFTAKKTTSFYYEYKVADAGIQNQTSSYEAPSMSSPGTISGTQVLAWIKVEAANVEGPSTNEFNNTFTALNVTNPGTPSLNDEVEDHISLEKQAD